MADVVDVATRTAGAAASQAINQLGIGNAQVERARLGTRQACGQSLGQAGVKPAHWPALFSRAHGRDWLVLFFYRCLGVLDEQLGGPDANLIQQAHGDGQRQL